VKEKEMEAKQAKIEEEDKVRQQEAVKAKE